MTDSDLLHDSVIVQYIILLVKVLNWDVYVYRYVVSSKNTAKIKKILVGQRKCKVFKRPGHLCPDLVYTFFHPLLKDEEETSIHIQKLKGGFVFHISIFYSQPVFIVFAERSTASFSIVVAWSPIDHCFVQRYITGLVSSL
jgi:hypothetical protein